MKFNQWYEAGGDETYYGWIKNFRKGSSWGKNLIFQDDLSCDEGDHQESIPKLAKGEHRKMIKNLYEL
jgi:hypothetical protein